MSFTNTPLYGGAITVDLPSNFADTRSVLKFHQPHPAPSTSRTSAHTPANVNAAKSEKYPIIKRST